MSEVATKPPLSRSRSRTPHKGKKRVTPGPAADDSGVGLSHSNNGFSRSCKDSNSNNNSSSSNKQLEMTGPLRLPKRGLAIHTSGGALTGRTRSPSSPATARTAGVLRTHSTLTPRARTSSDKARKFNKVDSGTLGAGFGVPEKALKKPRYNASERERERDYLARIKLHELQVPNDHHPLVSPSHSAPSICSSTDSDASSSASSSSSGASSASSGDYRPSSMAPPPHHRVPSFGRFNFPLPSSHSHPSHFHQQPPRPSSIPPQNHHRFVPVPHACDNMSGSGSGGLAVSQDLELPRGYEMRGRQRRSSVSAETNYRPKSKSKTVKKQRTSSVAAPPRHRRRGSTSSIGDMTSSELTELMELDSGGSDGSDARRSPPFAMPRDASHIADAVIDAMANARISVPGDRHGGMTPSPPLVDSPAMLRVQSDTSSDDEEKEPTAKTPEVLARIEHAVKGSLIFSPLTQQQSAQVFQVMKEVRVFAGQVVMKQGDDGLCAYVVDSGHYVAYVSTGLDRAMVAQYHGSGTFGELALMYNSPRSVTVEAVTDGVLWQVDRETFRRIIIASDSDQKKKSHRFLQTFSLMCTLSEEDRKRIVDVLEPVEFKDGDYIIRQGDDAEHFYLLVDGSVRVTQWSSPMRTMEIELGRVKRGEYFGELGLLSGGKRSANVIAIGHVRCLVLAKASWDLLTECRPYMQKHASLYKNVE